MMVIEHRFDPMPAAGLGADPPPVSGVLFALAVFSGLTGHGLTELPALAWRGSPER